MNAILVAANYQKIEYDLETSINELISLSEACNIFVKEVIIQNIDKINSATYIGIGKVFEIKEIIDEDDLVIFNEELSPLHLKNLTDLLNVEVLDRSDLILRIFESRANTKESKLQVEIAKKEYMLPRLIGMNEHLYSQLGGKGFRGSGETKLELDRRRITRQVHKAKKELVEIKKERQIQRSSRQKRNIKQVALVGYTNSGKSSLLNLYTDKKVLQKDMLFATLQTSSRKVRMKNHELILSDTVGFINQLPHHLIEAFKSTLEEVIVADLILLVIDSSSYYYQTQIETTLKVLDELGVKNTPILYVFNKIDLIDDFIENYHPSVSISVKDHINIDLLEDLMIEMLYKEEECILHIPYNKGELYSSLTNISNILDTKYEEEYIEVRCNIENSLIHKYKDFIVK